LLNKLLTVVTVVPILLTMIQYY